LSTNKQDERKQHAPEFEDCVKQVMRQGHAKGSAFAICTATFDRANKLIYVGEGETAKLHLFSESVRLKDHKVSGVCIHPKRIFHPEEGMTHVYLQEELERAAPTLIGKPFGVDHTYVLPPPNVITNAWYDPKEDGVAFEGTVDDRIVEQIQSRAFKGLSIELNWLKPGGRMEYADGVAPRNFELTSVHFLKRFPPGDKDAYINFWNAIVEQLVVSPALTLDEKVAQLEEQLRELSEKVAVLAGKFEVVSGIPQSIAMKEAEWDASFINELPDTSFAVVSKGGQRDEQGKTVPRTLRHLPHHKADGSLDVPHLRNALARLQQTELSLEDRAEAKKHLCAHARDSEIVSEVCGEPRPRQSESEAVAALQKQLAETEAKLAQVQRSVLEKEAAWAEKLAEAERTGASKLESSGVVALRKQLIETEAKLASSQRQAASARASCQRLVEAIKGTHPVIGVQRSWSLGPQKMIAEQLRVMREFESKS